MQHIKRWITALVLIPILLFVLLTANIHLLAVLVSVVAILAIREYLRIIFGNDKGPVSNTIKIISYSISMILIISACLGSWEVLFLVIAMNFMANSIFVLARFKSNLDTFEIISKQVLGIVYIPVSLALLIFIKELEGGTFWIIWLLLVTFSNDSGAFYTGTFLGKRKLSPNISPNKTIEGAIGGAITAMVIGFIFCLIFFKNISLAFLMIPGALMLAGAGTIGDLFESAMKRTSRIKDSGKILPGHGGMLDRIDGLLLAIPVLYVYLVFVL